jgi:site-specific DNA-methyltransferase (adenine-specific)
VTGAACIAGDARDEASYARALGGEKAAALITDPPYCLLTRRRRDGDLRDPKGRKIEGEPVIRFEAVRDYRKFTEEWLSIALRHLTEAAPLLIWTNFLGKEPILQTARAHGFHYRGDYAWAKLAGAVRSGQVLKSNEELARVFEVALVLTRQDGPRDPGLPWSAIAGPDDDGEAARFGAHPNHKPFGVLEPLLLSWSRPGELVLDPFAGSGSIPAAALKLRRRAACIELRPEWAARVADRLRATSGA